MNFFKPKEAKPQSSSSPQKSEFPNPFFSFFDNLLYKKNKKNLALTNAEIKKRLHGTHVYTVSDSTGLRYCASSDTAERDIEFYFFSKPDAEQFLHKAEPAIQVEPSTQIQLRGVPLTQVVDYEGEGFPIRLVPEISEINNAVQEREKNVGFPDEKFSGVPVFQADDLALRFDGDPNTYRLAYFRKDDLEKALSERGPIHTNKEREIIQVAALEDIIQEMKDPSTSKSNDIYFVAPGKDPHKYED